jgi:histidyl-tRNA synthetase
VVLVNSIGDSQCRPQYIQKLREYFAEHVDALCPDCRQRFERNPLRLLDCKKGDCGVIAQGAPRSVDYLCDECGAHWEALLGYLARMDIAYEMDHHLVRGLDYYTRTVFEIQPRIGGAQSTVLGGGRYDGLIEMLGGKPTPAVGFASGVERLVLNIKQQGVQVPGDPRPVIVVHLGDEARKEALPLTQHLLKQSIAAIMAPPGRSLRAQMRYASSQKAAYAVILGEDELSKGVVALRDMTSGEQKEVTREELPDHLSE